MASKTSPNLHGAQHWARPCSHFHRISPATPHEAGGKGQRLAQNHRGRPCRTRPRASALSSGPEKGLERKGLESPRSQHLNAGQGRLGRDREQSPPVMGLSTPQPSPCAYMEPCTPQRAWLCPAIDPLLPQGTWHGPALKELRPGKSWHLRAWSVVLGLTCKS